MKKTISALAICASVSAMAGTNLYKNFTTDTPVKKEYKIATQKEVENFPVKTTKNLKYYRAPSGEYILYNNNKLVSVNISKVTNDSLESLNTDIKALFKNPKFINSRTLVINKKTRKSNRVDIKTESELYEKRKEILRIAEEKNAMIVTSLAFIESDKSKRALVIYVSDFIKEKGCATCDFVNEAEPLKREEKNLVLVFSK